ncbi:unnamed protein product [Effrenium voratum]|uniref:RRM domain-containing protein n=1 Tax=Effrenium voratum TaxID=2562239 RepID=A0AA36JLP2_9DINO|nr:unnamed protein product [Effrenium voratum]
MGWGKGKGGGQGVWNPWFNPMMMAMMKGKGKGKGLRGFEQKVKVWIGGLPADNCSIELNKKLKEHMCQAGGTCVYAEVGKSGNAGAAFKTEEEAQAAITALNGSVFEGVPIEASLGTKSLAGQSWALGTVLWWADCQALTILRSESDTAIFSTFLSRKVTRTFWQISVNFKRPAPQSVREARSLEPFEKKQCLFARCLSRGANRVFRMWSKGWDNRGVSAPVGSNPFAPGGAAPGGPGGGGGRGPDEAATGPMLGRGSELQKVYYMPHNMGHNDGMVMAENKIFSGGRDENLFVWRAEKNASGELQLVQDCPSVHLGSSVTSLCYEAASTWLFCGLWSGEIRAFCKQPVKEERLTGHRRSVTCLQVHSSVLISGSNEGTVRLWTAANGSFQCHGQPLTNPSGPVTCLRVFNGALWVGGQTGISCFDLGSLQARGTIASQQQVTGLLECQGFMIATFRNGEVSIYDASGGQIFHRPPMGEHTSNTAVELMMHPTANKPMLLCGQLYGYVTAYDLPEFKPRGSFCCKDRSDVKAIVDAKGDGVFLTAGLHGDIIVWQWGGAGGASPFTPGASPFAPAAAVPSVANPFAQGQAGCGGGCCGCGGGCPGGPAGGMMM